MNHFTIVRILSDIHSFERVMLRARSCETGRAGPERSGYLSSRVYYVDAFWSRLYHVLLLGPHWYRLRDPLLHCFLSALACLRF